MPTNAKDYRRSRAHALLHRSCLAREDSAPDRSLPPWVRRTLPLGDFGYGRDDDSGDDSTPGSLYSENALYAHYPDNATYDVAAGPEVRGQPTGAISADRGQPGRRDGSTPCWNEQCDRTHGPMSRYALCSACGTFEFGSKPCLL